MEVLPGETSYVYNTNLTAKQVNLPKSMIVGIASNAPTCIVHAYSDELQGS